MNSSKYVAYLEEKHLCELCDSPAIECHHIKTRKRSGVPIDKDWNLIAICRRCHRLVHDYGLNGFIGRNFKQSIKLKALLEKKGWELFNGKWISPEIVK